jgi:hypothetical protein
MPPRRPARVDRAEPSCGDERGLRRRVLKNQALTTLAASENLALIECSTPVHQEPDVRGGLDQQRWLRHTRHFAGSSHRNTRFFVPAGAFFATTSTPAMWVDRDRRASSFDPSTQQDATAIVDVPSQWVNFNIVLLVGTPTNSGLTGNTSGTRLGLNSGSATIALKNAGSPSVFPGVAADTYTQNAFLLGVLLKRAA